LTLSPASRAVAELDPRVVRSRAAILRATADLLIELGATGVTIDGVAERSGVAKTTIYRHWKSRSSLVVDAFESLLAPSALPSHNGPIRQQLEAILVHFVHGLTRSEWARAVSTLIDGADRDPEMRQLLHDFLAVRMEPGRDALRAAVERGELGADLDVDEAIAMLVGPIFYRRFVSRENLDEPFVMQLVDLFLLGAGSRSR